jgi:uncharacterized surface protein with fasciclin (FAS1) repeats
MNSKETHMTPKRTITALAATAALGAAALAPTASAAPADAQASASKNIVQTAAAAGKFDTLLALVKQAGLAGALKGDGPLTVFAPTDAAFDKVPDKTLNALAKDKKQLRAVLLYHVAAGKLTAKKIVNRSSIETLNGKSVRVRVNGEKVKVGDARVTAADVKASNGVIHVINRVLIP